MAATGRSCRAHQRDSHQRCSVLLLLPAHAAARAGLCKGAGGKYQSKGMEGMTGRLIKRKAFPEEEKQSPRGSQSRAHGV